MRLLFTALVMIPAIAGAENTVIENSKTLTIDCAKDPVISLIGNHNKITLAGPCKKLTITGSHETVAGSVAVILVAGNDNEVALDASDEITVAGSDNTVSWTSGKPKIANNGKRNKVGKK